jgi:hypothetical protein
MLCEGQLLILGDANGVSKREAWRASLAGKDMVKDARGQAVCFSHVRRVCHIYLRLLNRRDAFHTLFLLHLAVSLYSLLLVIPIT